MRAPDVPTLRVFDAPASTHRILDGGLDVLVRMMRPRHDLNVATLFTFINNRIARARLTRSMTPRGGEADETLVLLDGMELHAPSCDILL